MIDLWGSHVVALIIKAPSVLYFHERVSPFRDRAPFQIAAIYFVVQPWSRGVPLGETHPTRNGDIINELSVVDKKPSTTFG
jgi:hypothetical protein